MDEILLIMILLFFGQTLGALVGLIKKPGKNMMEYSLAFAAAMMCGISFFQLIPEAIKIAPVQFMIIGIIIGILLILLIERILPHVHPELCNKLHFNHLKCVVMLITGMSLHNIIEGLAVGVSFVLSPALGSIIALAIAAQDIPENIAAIMPTYALTKNKLKAFGILCLTTLFELAGFVIGYFFLKNLGNEYIGIALGAAAGIMIFISTHELIPGAEMKKDTRKKLIIMILGLITVILFGIFFKA